MGGKMFFKWIEVHRIFCFQLLILSALNRVEETVDYLKAFLQQDIPDHVRQGREVFEEVVSLHCFAQFIYHQSHGCRISDMVQRLVDAWDEVVLTSKLRLR